MASKKTSLIPTGQIEQIILFIRGHKVMIDAALARVYGVTTKRLREQVRRNLERFPDDFMFQLSKGEHLEVAAFCGELYPLKFSRTRPYAFTEHGAIMLSTILNSAEATHTSVQVVRAFVRLREILATHKDLARKLQEMEKRYDHQFKVVFDKIRELMAPPPLPPKRKIGF